MLSVLSEESTDLDSSGGSSLPLDSSESWFADILNVDDLVEIDPNRGQFLVKLQVWYIFFFANVRSILVCLFCKSGIYPPYQIKSLKIDKLLFLVSFSPRKVFFFFDKTTSLCNFLIFFMVA